VWLECVCVQETLKNKIMKRQKPSGAQFRKKRKEEEKKRAKEKGKSLNPVLAQNEFQIRKRSRMRELPTLVELRRKDVPYHRTFSYSLSHSSLMILQRRGYHILYARA